MRNGHAKKNGPKFRPAGQAIKKDKDVQLNGTGAPHLDPQDPHPGGLFPSLFNYMKLSPHSVSILLLFSLSIIGYSQDLPANQNEHRIDTSKLQDGDLVFIRSHSRNAKAISEVTHSNFTHCGIVFNVGGIWKVREGAGMDTNYLDLNKWQDKESTDYETGKIITYEPIAVRRLTEMKNWPPNDKSARIERLQQEARKLHETKYDFGFAWDNHYKVGTEDREYVYCSELVFKAFYRALGIELGKPQPIKDYPLNANAITILNDVHGKECRGNMPYNPDEPAISPQEIYDSGLLETINVEIP